MSYGIEIQRMGFNMQYIEVKKDLFNSEVFRIEMGNMTINNDGKISDSIRVDVQKAIISARKEGYQHLTCKVSTSDKGIVKALEENGFYLVDTAITFCFQFGKNQLRSMEYKCRLGDCQKEDLQELMRIAKESYSLDRFHSDPKLPNDLCDEYYEKWIQNSVNGFADKTLVAYYDNKVVGFTTGKRRREEEYYDLVLSAVDINARGLNIYTSMIHYMTNYVVNLAEKDSTLKGILLETQVDNYPVLRAWIKLGYTPYSSLYVFQRDI